MKYVVKYKDGRYVCSPRMLAENEKFARHFKTEHQAENFLEASGFIKKECTIIIQDTD